MTTYDPIGGGSFESGRPAEHRPASIYPQAPVPKAQYFTPGARTLTELVAALEAAPAVADLRTSGACERGGFFGAYWHQQGPHRYWLEDSSHLTLLFFLGNTRVTFEHSVAPSHAGPFVEIVPPDAQASWGCGGPMTYLHVCLPALSATPSRSEPRAIDDVILRRLGITLGELLRRTGGLDRTESAAWATILAAHVSRLEGDTHCNGVPEPAKRSVSSAETARIARYVDDHLQATITVSELAQLTAMSRAKFSQAFKLTTGLSPYQFVVNRRTLMARQLLASSTLSLSAIAQRVGFSSQSHMTSTFHRLTGVTPREYRRSQLAGAGHASRKLRSNGALDTSQSATIRPSPIPKNA